MSHVYNADFYDYINKGSRNSARAVIPLMQSIMQIDSVLDVGAGVGAWAAEWMSHGITDILAVDGFYASSNALLVPQHCFRVHDLARPLSLDRHFDLVQSLEVAEHIAADKADLFVDTLVAHADIILFSAATPGQGGEHHVNEQEPDYWRRKFGSRDFQAFDWLRPRLSKCADVQPWYKYNSIIYANAAGQRRLAQNVLVTRVADGQILRSRGSAAWYARRALVRMMPVKLATRIAMINAQRQAHAARRHQDANQ